MFARNASSQLDLLRSILGARIQSVSRDVFLSDIAAGDSLEYSHGTIELTCDSGVTVTFVAITESMSVGVVAGRVEGLGSSFAMRLLDNEPRWLERRDGVIERICIYRERIEGDPVLAESALQFSLSKGAPFVVQYIDSPEKPDSLVILEVLRGQLELVLDLRG